MTTASGAAGLPHRTIDGAGHFIQEHAPAACVDAGLRVVDRTQREDWVALALRRR